MSHETLVKVSDPLRITLRAPAQMTLALLLLLLSTLRMRVTLLVLLSDSRFLLLSFATLKIRLAVKLSNQYLSHRLLLRRTRLFPFLKLLFRNKSAILLLR